MIKTKFFALALLLIGTVASLFSEPFVYSGLSSL